MTIEKEEDKQYRDGLSSETAIAEAAENGTRVVFPEARQLFIDIDSDEAYNHYLSMLAFVRRLFSLAERRETPSKEGWPHAHIVLDTERDLTPIERIALQAILGSDPKREFLSFNRIENDDPHPTLFFERKEEQ